MHLNLFPRATWVFGAALSVMVATLAAQQTSPALPSSNLLYGAFKARFAEDGTFTLTAQGLAAIQRHLEDRAR